MITSKDRALSPQSPYKKQRLKPYHIKYYGLIAVVLMMIAAIQVWANYGNIQSSIATVREEKELLMRRQQYSALQAYVYSLPVSKIFIAHDNGILADNERVIIAWSWTVAKTIAANWSWSSAQWTTWQQTISGETIWTWAEWMSSTNTGISEQDSIKLNLPPRKSRVIYFWEKIQ